MSYETRKQICETALPIEIMKYKRELIYCPSIIKNPRALAAVYDTGFQINSTDIDLSVILSGPIRKSDMDLYKTNEVEVCSIVVRRGFGLRRFV